MVRMAGLICTDAFLLNTFTLVSTVDQKVSTESTFHDIVELLFDELVTVHFMNFSRTLPDSTGTTQFVERTSVSCLTN